MAKKSSTFEIAAIPMFVVVVMMAFVGGWAANAGGLSAAECRLERRVGINACKSVLYGSPPSPLCCRRLRIAHLQCICPDVTPKLAALIDINRAIRIVQGCGRRLPHRYKCGSITIP